MRPRLALASLCRALSSLDICNDYLLNLKESYVWTQTCQGNFYLPHPWSRCGTAIVVKRLVPYSIELIDTIYRRDFASRYIHLSRNATSPLHAILINIFRPLAPVSRLTIISRLTAMRTDINRDLNTVIYCRYWFNYTIYYITLFLSSFVNLLIISNFFLLFYYNW